jgi:uncharacterized protein (DUF433 family)
MGTAVKEVRHPYISVNRKVRGGEPVIAGTGIRVLDIAVRYEIMGETPEDIISVYPHVTLPQVHDALSYYYEHKSAMDKTWKDAVKQADAMRKSHPSVLEKKLGKIKDLQEMAVVKTVYA